MKWYHAVLWIVANIGVSLLVTVIFVNVHERSYAHLESRHVGDGRINADSDYRGVLQYFKYEEWDDGKKGAYIGYAIPSREYVQSFTINEDGSHTDRTEKCYFDGEEIPCH